MNISNVNVGDVVEVEMRGWKFLARVEGLLPKDHAFDLEIRPEKTSVTHRHCNANDVTQHFKKMGRPRSGAKTAPKEDAKPLFEKPKMKQGDEDVAPPKKSNPFIAKAKAKTKAKA